jgi:opacity protein-like surface antigen
MQKIRLLLLLAVLFSFPVISHAQAFEDNANLIYLGFGLPPGRTIAEDIPNKDIYTNYHLNNYGTGILRYEHGLNKYFGVGLNLEYSAASVNYKYDPNQLQNPRYTYTHNISLIGGYIRLNGHFPVGDKFDLYGGVGLGYTDKIDKATDTNPNNANTNNQSAILNFDWQVTLGARYMVKKGFGMFAEFGYATTNAQIGIVFRF